MKKATSNKKITFQDRLPNDRGEYLELLIYMTDKRISPGYFDTTMENQSKRLKAELAVWKKANRK